MQFTTPVSLPSPFPVLHPKARVISIGSCFAEHIGERMAKCLPGRRFSVNPTGVVYNPVSIGLALQKTMAETFDAEEELAFEAGSGRWCHWKYSTLFHAPSRTALTDTLRQHWQKAKDVAEKADVLIVTFSTDHVYMLGDGTPVANCHKQPARLFREETADYDRTAEAWKQLTELLLDARPERHVIFTLSPYRYAKYGMHENALSKARLLLLIDRLCRTDERIRYFPAYEIITDELRDYRFYESDMLHPSEQAVDYVWERFTEWAFTPDMKTYARERQQIYRDLSHRPTDPGSAAYAAFKAQTEERKRRFEKKWGETW